MKKQYVIPFLLGLLVLLVVGAAGVNSLFKFNEWDSGATAPGAVWTQDASKRSGSWSNLNYQFIQGGSENAVIFFDSNGKMSQDVNFFKYLSTAKRLEVYGKIAAITNGAAVTETEILVVTNNLITLYNPSDFVPTNNAASNLTMNAATGPIVRRLFITNNITITNITPPSQGQNVAFKWRIEPQLIPRGLLLPTLNGNQFGVRLETNANNTIWTTLTNGVTYDLVIDFWGTNGRVAISEWKL